MQRPIAICLTALLMWPALCAAMAVTAMGCPIQQAAVDTATDRVPAKEQAPIAPASCHGAAPSAKVSGPEQGTAPQLDGEHPVPQPTPSLQACCCDNDAVPTARESSQRRGDHNRAESGGPIADPSAPAWRAQQSIDLLARPPDAAWVAATKGSPFDGPPSCNGGQPRLALHCTLLI